MQGWKKAVLVIRKEEMLYEIPGTFDIANAWYRYMSQFGLDPFDFIFFRLKKDKEFEKTWHITIKFRKRRDGE